MDELFGEKKTIRIPKNHFLFDRFDNLRQHLEFLAKNPEYQKQHQDEVKQVVEQLLQMVKMATPPKKPDQPDQAPDQYNIPLADWGEKLRDAKNVLQNTPAQDDQTKELLGLVNNVQNGLSLLEPTEERPLEEQPAKGEPKVPVTEMPALDRPVFFSAGQLKEQDISGFLGNLETAVNGWKNSVFSQDTESRSATLLSRRIAEFDRLTADTRKLMKGAFQNGKANRDSRFFAAQAKIAENLNQINQNLTELGQDRPEGRFLRENLPADGVSSEALSENLKAVHRNSRKLPFSPERVGQAGIDDCISFVDSLDTLLRAFGEHQAEFHPGFPKTDGVWPKEVQFDEKSKKLHALIRQAQSDRRNGKDFQDKVRAIGAESFNLLNEMLDHTDWFLNASGKLPNPALEDEGIRRGVIRENLWNALKGFSDAGETLLKGGRNRDLRAEQRPDSIAAAFRERKNALNGHQKSTDPETEREEERILSCLSRNKNGKLEITFGEQAISFAGPEPDEPEEPEFDNDDESIYERTALYSEAEKQKIAELEHSISEAQARRDPDTVFKNYLGELTRLDQELRRTNSRLSKDSPEYTALLTTLDRSLTSLKDAGSKSPREKDTAFRNAFQNISGAIDAYREKHAGMESLSSRQKKRLKAMGRMEMLKLNFAMGETDPRDNRKMMMAEKLVSNALVASGSSGEDAQNARDVLCSNDRFLQSVFAMQFNNNFQKMCKSWEKSVPGNDKFTKYQRTNGQKLLAMMQKKFPDNTLPFLSDAHPGLEREDSMEIHAPAFPSV